MLSHQHRRISLLLAFLLVVSTPRAVLGFAPSTTPALQSRHGVVAKPQSTTTALSAIRRRAALTWVKKALLAGVGISTAASRLERAAAEDEAGKIVTLTVDNLNGEPGNTGTIKIQLQPSWAPRGVERFEVSFRVYSPNQRKSLFGTSISSFPLSLLYSATNRSRLLE